LAHAVLLFHGDILTTYAVLGLVLLALRHQPDGRLFVIAKALVLVTALAWGVLALLLALFGDTADKAALAAAA
ncbi:hypothetical protein, partial [Klebsiella pneumoniae]|uniref:hypothetical protein n=1 Tax=Klebsiella pneumoniae TaxID=573 RepID=UPI003F7666AF